MHSASADGVDYPLAPDDRTRDAVHTIVSGRKSWKTLKGKGEAVWPPYLEAALVEGKFNITSIFNITPYSSHSYSLSF